MPDARGLMFLAGFAVRLSVYLAGATIGLGMAWLIGLSVRHVLHGGADRWDARAFFVALTFAMLADEVGKRLILGSGRA